MKAKGVWTIRSFLTCFLCNAVLIAIIYYAANQALLGIDKWVSTISQPGAAELPDDLRSALQNLGKYTGEIRLYLMPVLAGVGAAVTLLLWLLIMAQGRSFARAQEASSPSAALPKSAKPEPKAAEPPAAPTPEPPAQPSPQAAIQMLSILQREGRLIDFLQENLSLYEDAQIGAAVRNIHQGCKSALTEYVELKPVFEEEEGTEITVPAGFDSLSIRLTGNVTGDPPFKGVLRHRGWKAAKVDLPQTTSDPQKKKDWIVAAAEVEVEG